MLDFLSVRETDILPAVKITKENINEVADWVNGALKGDTVIIFDEKYDSTDKAQIGDWIIRDGFGNFSICQDEDFDEAYEITDKDYREDN